MRDVREIRSERRGSIRKEKGDWWCLWERRRKGFAGGGCGANWGRRRLSGCDYDLVRRKGGMPGWWVLLLIRSKEAEDEEEKDKNDIFCNK